MTNTFTSLYRDLAKEKWDTSFILCLLLGEAILTFAIFKHVPYTEIDWEAYMQEVTMWQEGERDYLKIKGGTGPLVYPVPLWSSQMDCWR